MGFWRKILISHHMKALQSANSDARYKAARALGQLRARPAVWNLINALEDTYGPVRFWAADALGIIGDDCAVDPLLKHLTDLDANVQTSAAEALGRIGDVRAAGPLVRYLLSGPSKPAVSAVTTALARIGPSVMKPLLDALRRWDDGTVVAAKTLAQLGLRPSSQEDRNISTLALLCHDNTYAWTLRPEDRQPLPPDEIALDGADGMTCLLKALTTPLGNHVEVMKIAADVLGKLADVRAVPALVKILVAARTQHQVNTSEAIEALKVILSTHGTLVSVADLMTIAQLPDKLLRYCYFPGYHDVRDWYRHDLPEDCSPLKSIATKLLTDKQESAKHNSYLGHNRRDRITSRKGRKAHT
jgi:HEAT repeat protein